MIVCFHQLLHCQLILPCLAQCNAMQWVWLPTVANSLSSQGSTTVTVCWPVLHSTSLIVSRLSWTLPHDSSMVLASLTEYSIWSATVSIGYQSTRGCSLSCVYWLIKLCTAQLHTTSLTCASRCPPLMPGGDSDLQHTRISSSLRLSRSSELAHSPSLPHLSGTDCRYTFVPSSRSTVLKLLWSLSSSPLTAPNWYVLRHCMISVWQVISHCVEAHPCNDFVVLRHIRNCLCIIIIVIIIINIAEMAQQMWHEPFILETQQISRR